MSKMKTAVPARVGEDGMPIAEKITLGWAIMSPGREINHSYLMFTKTTQEDCIHLCSLDVLGLVSEHYPQCVHELSEGIYVDNMNIGGDTVEETLVLKEQAKEILNKGSFVLHKWHSNAAELESDNVEDGESTYAKETLGTKPLETKLLGLGWNKKRDTLSVSLSKPKV